MPRVADIVAFLERFAPLELAEDWDNVGLLIGERQHDAARVLTCLTLTSDVAQEAIERQVNLIVTHHPVLFGAVKRLTADDSQGRMLLRLIAAGIAVYSPHTAYDSAADGINQQLAQRLGLAQIEALRQAPVPGQCKIVCFVPRSHLSSVQAALWEIGAGTIGEYSKCSFVVDGVGSFEGSGASHPAIGKAQCLEQVAEARLEVICPEALVPEAIRCLKGAHPYEEPACDVYPLVARSSRHGSGRVGELTLPAGEGSAISPAITLKAAGCRFYTLGEFVTLVKTRLGFGALSFVGERGRLVSRVAIACGSGGEFLSEAINRQCDVLLTGEARFHTCLEAREAGIGLVLAGHYATERPGVEQLAAVLAREFPDATVWASEVECDPVQWMPCSDLPPAP
jgi:dinuclear metal center YbgI/SA1388 family protein